MYLKNLLFTLSLLLLSSICNSMERPRLLLIDTANRPPKAHHGLQSLCTQVGFSVDFIHSYNLNIQNHHDYDVAWVLSTDLNNPVIENLQRNAIFKTYGSLLPSYLSPKIIEFFTQHPIGQSNYFLQKLSTYSQHYDTALLYKKKSSKDHQVNISSSNNSLLLPTNSLQPLITFQPKHESNEFIARMGLLNFYELSEEPTISPIRRTIREQLLKDILQALMQLKALCSNELIANSQLTNPELPYEFTERFEHECFTQARAIRAQQMHENYTWIHEQGIYAGWMDLDPLMQSEETLAYGIQAISDANLNLLWLELNPEQYLRKSY